MFKRWRCKQRKLGAEIESLEYNIAIGAWTDEVIRLIERGQINDAKNELIRWHNMAKAEVKKSGSSATTSSF